MKFRTEIDQIAYKLSAAINHLSSPPIELYQVIYYLDYTQINSSDDLVKPIQLARSLFSAQMELYRSDAWPSDLHELSKPSGMPISTSAIEQKIWAQRIRTLIDRADLIQHQWKYYPGSRQRVALPEQPAPIHQV